VCDPNRATNHIANLQQSASAIVQNFQNFSPWQQSLQHWRFTGLHVPVVATAHENGAAAGSGISATPALSYSSASYDKIQTAM
jgi:hypothetical protein